MWAINSLDPMPRHTSFGSSFTVYRRWCQRQTAARNSSVPWVEEYWWIPGSWRTSTRRSVRRRGGGWSGSPIPRLMMSLPAFSRAARLRSNSAKRYGGRRRRRSDGGNGIGIPRGKLETGSRKRVLALRVLDASTRAAEAVLLALLHARIAGQQALLAELLFERRIGLHEGAGDAEADRAGLAGEAAAGARDEEVEAPGGAGLVDGLDGVVAVLFREEVLVQGPAVHRDDAGAGRHADARDGGL